jgi:hypothetical protein
LRFLAPSLRSLVLLAAAGGAPPDSRATTVRRADDPVAAFAELEGAWRGTFVGWDASGKELYRISVRQVYRTVDANVQEVELSDADAAGKTTTGKGRNVARRLPDGSLELRCIVDKSDGDHVEHEGRLVTGPDGEGDREIVWFSRRDVRSETFRERVRGTGAQAVYEIDGMGRYGDALILMAGRYRRE